MTEQARDPIPTETDLEHPAEEDEVEAHKRRKANEEPVGDADESDFELHRRAL